MVRYLFYTIGDLTYQSPLVQNISRAFMKLHVWDHICSTVLIKLPARLSDFTFSQ